MPHDEHEHDSPRRSALSLQLAPASETVIDPVCGMTVEPASAAGSYTHGGTTYYFCSRHCLEKFKANPEQYLGGKRAESCCGHAAPPAPAMPGVKYTCPMHP